MRLKRGTPFHLVSNASNNARVVRGGAGYVMAIWGTNTNVSTRFLKFFDLAETPNPAIELPFFVYGIRNDSAGLAIPGGICFDQGIAFAIVSGAADFNNGSVAAAEVVISFVFR